MQVIVNYITELASIELISTFWNNFNATFVSCIIIAWLPINSVTLSHLELVFMPTFANSVYTYGDIM